MSNAERTRHMTDAEVLEDLKAQRALKSSPKPAPGFTSWQLALLCLFALIGFAVVFNAIISAGLH